MSKTSSMLLCGLVIAALAVLACDAKDPRICPKHEKYFACGANCQTLCSTLGEPCLIQHIRCPDGCYCRDGYARNEAGECISISKCPAKS